MATPGGFDPSAGAPGEPGGPTVPAGPTGPSGPGGPTNVGLAPNVAAALCYVPLCCLNIIWAVYVVAVEKQSRFLRFHAFQSLLWAGAMIVAGLVVAIVSAVSATLGMLLNVLLLIIGVGGSLFLAFKAYSNEEFELPQLGALARQWV
jgi:uncharacterized membrane protein